MSICIFFLIMLLPIALAYASGVFSEVAPGMSILGLVASIFLALFLTFMVCTANPKKSICPVCGEVYPADYSYCNIDGAELEAE